MDAGPLAAKSAASWPSIIAGAFVAAASTVILVALGSGIGFASISPWPDRGASVTSFAMTTAIWLIVTQWVSAALGGYIAGRLRTRWIGTHPHEVFFRDTAHGLITWAVATILVVAVGASSFMWRRYGRSRCSAGPALIAVPGSEASGECRPRFPVPYEIDKLFRSSNFGGAALLADARMEAAHIAANAFARRQHFQRRPHLPRRAGERAHGSLAGRCAGSCGQLRRGRDASAGEIESGSGFSEKGGGRGIHLPGLVDADRRLYSERCGCVGRPNSR